MCVYLVYVVVLFNYRVCEVYLTFNMKTYFMNSIAQYSCDIVEKVFFYLVHITLIVKVKTKKKKTSLNKT